MNGRNGMLERMFKEAMEELASGEKGWKDIETNTLFLACFGMLYNHLASRLVKPLWWFAGCAIAAVITYIVSVVLGG